MINPKHDLLGVDIAKAAIEAATSVAGKGSVFWQSIGELLPLENCSVDVFTNSKNLSSVYIYLKESDSKSISTSSSSFRYCPNLDDLSPAFKKLRRVPDFCGKTFYN